MATISLADVAFRTLPHHLFVSTGIGGSNSYAHAKKYSLNCRIPSKSKRFISNFLIQFTLLILTNLLESKIYSFCRKFVYKSDSLFKTRAVARCSMVCYYPLLVFSFLFSYKLSYNICTEHCLLLI